MLITAYILPYLAVFAYNLPLPRTFAPSTACPLPAASYTLILVARTVPLRPARPARIRCRLATRMPCCRAARLPLRWFTFAAPYLAGLPCADDNLAPTLTPAGEITLTPLPVGGARRGGWDFLETLLILRWVTLLTRAIPSFALFNFTVDDTDYTLPAPQVDLILPLPRVCYALPAPCLALCCLACQQPAPCLPRPALLPAFG